MAVIYGLKSDKHSIEVLENTFSIKFPEDYRTFLLEKNGLFVDGDGDCIHFVYAGVNQGFDFHLLYGINTKEEYSNITYANTEYLDELEFIPFAFLIGEDPGGNFYVLVTEGSDSGVYYWDYTYFHEANTKQDYSFEEADEYGPLYRIADNFTCFYQLLEVDLKKFRISEETL